MPKKFELLQNALDMLEPYTHKKFIKAQKEMEKLKKKQIQEAVDKETEIIRNKYKDDTEKMANEMLKMQQKYEEERRNNEKYFNSIN